MTAICFGMLRISQFKSIDSLTIDLSRKPGCYAVRGRNEVNPRLGSNGAGKSSIWDALTFALYGKTPRLLRSLDLVPWHDAKANPVVNLRVLIDGNPHDIIRHANPHKLKLDGKVAVQQQVDDLIRIPFELFLHTVLFAQAKPLFLDLAPRDKLAMISEVLRLERFDTYAQHAIDRVKELDFEIAELEGKEKGYASRIADLKEDIGRWTDLTKSFDKNRKSQIADQTTELDVIAARLREAEDERAKASIAAEKAKRWRQQCETDVMNANIEMTKAAQAAGENRMAQEQMKLLKDGICSVCGQKIDKAHRDHRLKLLKDAVAALPNMSLIQGHASQVQDMLNAARRVESELDHAKYKAEHAAAILANDHTKAKSNLHLIMAQVNPHADQVKGLGAKLAGVEHERETVGNVIETMRTGATRYAVWPQLFKDMRLNLLNEFMQTLTVITNNVTAELGLDTPIEFSVERESKSGTVIKGINCNIGSARFEGLSGGEGQRLRLAASIAFSQVILEHLSIEVGQIILDEPSQHLSPGGLKELTAYLTAHANASGKTLFIADQRPITDVTGSMTVVRKAQATSMEA